MSGTSRTASPRRRMSPASSSSRMRPLTMSHDSILVSAVTAVAKARSLSRTGWNAASAARTSRRSAASRPLPCVVARSAKRRSTSARSATSDANVVPESSPRSSRSAATTATNGQSALIEANWRVSGSKIERSVSLDTRLHISACDKSSSVHRCSARGDWFSFHTSASSMVSPYGRVASRSFARGRCIQSCAAIPATPSTPCTSSTTTTRSPVRGRLSKSFGVGA